MHRDPCRRLVTTVQSRQQLYQLPAVVSQRPIKKGRESIANFDIKDLMSTRPDINARFRVAWDPEFQGMTLDNLAEIAVLGQGTYGRSHWCVTSRVG